MPIVPYNILNSVFYLYRNRADAEAGTDAGGTGFFLAMPTDDGLGHHYGVTNWHVAVRNGFSCVRINTTSGPEVIEFDPADWIFEANRDDIAVVPLSIRRQAQIAWFVGTQVILTREHEAHERIGPGDDVFMVGRFVDLDMRETNVPSVRFGNISTRPVAIPQPTGYKEGLSYCVDMHSRTGYSGSPVFVYRTPDNTLEWTVTGERIQTSVSMFLLLGIHWGQFSEQLPIKRRKKSAQQQSHLSRDLYEEYIEGMSGMTCVIPAWRIAELLSHDTLRKKREEEMALRGRGSA
jgi:hypothetical protein